MTYAAVCTECEWSFEHAQEAHVAERLDHHSRVEGHRVELTRRAFEAPV
jgi:hypothetical protein